MSRFSVTAVPRKLVVFLVVVLASGLAIGTPAMAQAPVPKVTINGLIDQLGTYTSNMSHYDQDYGRAADQQVYGRTRGRFDVVGEIGRAKAVLGIEIDAYWGQTGSTDSGVTGGRQGFGATGGWDINTDTIGQIELKWLYTEFPMFLVPNTTVRLGAQPFGTAATYKLATYATGDFPGVNWVTQFGPAAALNLTYAQVEERLTGKDFSLGTWTGTAAAPNRGEDWAIIASFDFTPFKGLDIKPMYSYFHAAGVTAGPYGPRQGKGGIANAATAFDTGDIEARHTIGIDARWTAGPFSLAPTILYQFGSRDTTIGTSRAEADISAWLADVRAGFQVGPLALAVMAAYSTGNKASDNIRSEINYYQPLSTDSSYAGDWGTQILSLGIDYFNQIHYTAPGLSPGIAISYDRYGRMQLGAKASYSFTPALSVGAAVTSAWTAEKVDTDSTFSAATGLTPSAEAKGDERYLGTELDLSTTYRFAPGLTFDLVGAYLFAGDALGYTSPRAFSKDPKDVMTATARVRFAF